MTEQGCCWKPPKYRGLVKTTYSKCDAQYTNIPGIPEIMACRILMSILYYVML